MRRKRHRSISLAVRQQGKRRIRRRYPFGRLLIIAVIALLAASVMLRRMLRPLHWPPYSHASRIALLADSSDRLHVRLTLYWRQNDTGADVGGFA
jgi:hypothetical protein